MCMNARSVFGVLFLATALRASAQPAATGWQVRLRDAMARAVDRSPELTAMEARIAASRHRVRQAEALPDPEVELGIRDIPASSPSLTRDDFTMEMLSARQRFPGSGKLSTGKRAAEAEQDAGRAEHSRHVIEISADVADAFF